VSHVLVRNHVTLTGRDEGPTIVFAHGFGCDQTVWDRVAPAFEPTHRVVRFDQVGCGGADPAAFDAERYRTLERYARDLVEIAGTLELADALYVGHSVAGAIGLLADVLAPGRFGQLAIVGASPRYLDDEGYHGGFTPEDLAGVFEAIDDNWLAWAEAMAPTIMGTPERPELGAELNALFGRLDPTVARTFARATFHADIRAVLPQVSAPVAVLHCTDDAIVPDEAARYLHEHLPRSRFVPLQATGHCPPLSAPEELITVLRSLERLPAQVR
jgi:sigma-B regulation protein RsbQ